MRNISVLSFIKAPVFVLFIVVFSVASQALERPPVRLFVHGDSTYAQRNAEGHIEGSLVDAFSCTMKFMKLPFTIETVPMLRVGELIDGDGLDIWYPLFDDGSKGKKEQFVHFGDDAVIYWFIWPSRTDAPNSPEFHRDARVTAFPSSGPARYLKEGGYQYITSTDDENAMMLWFLNGRLDAVLAPDFRSGLKPGARKIAEQFRMVEYARYDSGFMITKAYQKKYPGFKAGFATALKGCH